MKSVPNEKEIIANVDSVIVNVKKKKEIQRIVSSDRGSHLTAYKRTSVSLNHTQAILPLEGNIARQYRINVECSLHATQI